MKEIAGYIFIADIEGLRIPFGKNNETCYPSYKQFETNDLTAYKSRKELAKATQEFIERRMIISRPAKIFLRIADSQRELSDFVKRSNLIVIEKHRKFEEQILYGPIIKGFADNAPLPGAFLKYNNFTPYREEQDRKESPFERADNLRREIYRQTQYPAMIAEIRLEYVH